MVIDEAPNTAPHIFLVRSRIKLAYPLHDAIDSCALYIRLSAWSIVSNVVAAIDLHMYSAL